MLPSVPPTGATVMYDRAGKALTNEKTYPYVVELVVPVQGLDITISRQVMTFHKARHLRPRFGRTVFRDGANYHRWCFSDLETAQAFQQQFGGEFRSNLDCPGYLTGASDLRLRWRAERLSASMAAMSIMAHGHHWMQLELGRGGNNVEAGLTLDAYRLQRK